MQANSVSDIEIAIKKCQSNPELSNDLITYLKVLAIKYCPDEKLEEMKLLFENGNLSSFYDFVNQFIPDLSKIITDYVRTY